MLSHIVYDVLCGFSELNGMDRNGIAQAIEAHLMQNADEVARQLAPPNEYDGPVTYFPIARRSR